jgi:hypothetical protein
MRILRRQHSRSALPAVNLLSPWSFEAISTRRLRQRFSVACLGLALVVAAAWGVQHARVTQAEKVLSVEQAHVQLLTDETGALAPVQAFVTSVEQQKATVQETMTREIYFSLVLDALRAATPSGANVESAIVALAPEAPPLPATGTDPETGTGATTAEPVVQVPSLCPGPDPFNTLTVVGCMTLSGSAQNRRSVGDLVIGLGESKLFVEPFISTTTSADGTGVTFTGSVGLSERVFSNRYADLDELLKAVTR